VAILLGRNHGSTYQLGAAQERPRRWEPQVLSQVQLRYNLNQPIRASMETNVANTS
jgi:hypothetical protein